MGIFENSMKASCQSIIIEFSNKIKALESRRWVVFKLRLAEVFLNEIADGDHRD